MPDFSLFGEEHVRQYEATNGKTGHNWNDTQVLILRTTGRKSGELRKVRLIYGRDGDDYMVVASRGGAPQHPAWYLNLDAKSDIEIQVWGEGMSVKGRAATAEEKARLWSVMTKERPDYDKYQRATSRGHLARRPRGAP